MKAQLATLKVGNDPLVGVDLPQNADEEQLQQFINGAYLADQLSYPHGPDQAELDRLSAVIKGFPQGFRLYFSRFSNGAYIPVGYTGWYPIQGDIFNALHDRPETINHRGSMRPIPMPKDEDAFIYLFNYSIIAALHKSPQSGSMIRDLAQTLSTIPRQGMAAVCVSQSGKNVAMKFGMHHTGMMIHDGEQEAVYAMR